MLQKRRYLPCLVLVIFSFPSLMVAADTQVANSRLGAAQIVEKNVAARGGLAAWRSVQTMSMSGKMEAGGQQNTQLPFTLEMKRTRKTRLELDFQGQTAVQVYDGTNGWKLRPFLNRSDVEPYTPEELKQASDQADLDGLLIDYAAKGSKVQLEAMDRVEGRDAYKLKLTLKDGQTWRIWIDAETFLDVKIDGFPRRMDGKMRPVEISMRDYRSVQGVMVPYVLETAVEGVKQTHKMTIEKVVVNPNLDDSRFAKPL